MSISQKNYIPAYRKTVQGAYTLFCIYTGWQFYSFYLWTKGAGSYVPRPPAVEAFLPISALMSLKRLLFTGSWDMVHPAGLAIFIAIITSALLFRRSFCGWICPVGLLSDMFEKAGKAARINIRVPKFARYPLLGIKYLLLGFFTWIILIKMDVSSIESFLQAPYNITVDARMLMFFLEPTATSAGVMLGIAALSLVLKHYWCTYCCPYGALLGIFAFASPVHVKRKEEACKECHKCQHVCPADIRVWDMKSVRVPECIGCLECVAACPEDDCLETSTAGRRIPWWIVPVGTLAVLLSVWIAARWSGHWHSIITDQQFAQLYRIFIK